MSIFDTYPRKGETHPAITSVERGQYGQWIVAALVDGCFLRNQYYGMTKRQSIRAATWSLKDGVFAKPDS